MSNCLKCRDAQYFTGLVIFAILFLCSAGVVAQEQNSKLSLSNRYPQEVLKSALLTNHDFHPYPTAAEREPWLDLPEATREAYVKRGEKYLGKDWLVLPATLFLEFAQNGNRSHFEAVHFARRYRLADLVIAECVEGKGRFLNDIMNGIWAICEESFWGVPAHLYMQKMGPGLPDINEPVVDLFVGETVGLISWTYYLLHPQLDKVSPQICERLHQEIERRVLTPCLERDDFHWMGFHNERVNNWNPWCNSNWITAVLLVEQDETRRLTAISKILKSLDKFIGPYPSDGGCDEGPSYWGRAGASLFDCLELLHSATNGKINVYNESLIQNIGRYIYRAHIYDNYFINFADAPAKVNIDGELAYRFGERIKDDHLKQLGLFNLKKQNAENFSSSESLIRQLPEIFNLPKLRNEKGEQPLLRDAWFKDLQVMAARSKEGSPEGLYVAAKGGHNAESHNHNDVGNFIVYVDGRPAIIDVGVETYTAKTFSPQRYEIWTMQSAYHNLPTINGVMQKDGITYAARDVSYESDDAHAQIKLNIAGAYPKEANVVSWVRTVRLNRGKDIQIKDTYELLDNKSIMLSLMTPCNVKLEGSGKLILTETSTEAAKTAFQMNIQYDSKKLNVSLEDIKIEDGHLKSTWGDHLTRIILRAAAPSLKDVIALRIEK